MCTPHDAPPHYLFMLTVYLDESGQESKDFVVIAGFVGTNEQWDSFLPDWKRGVGGSVFHMNRLRWKDATGRRLAKLALLPYKHGLRAVVGAVRVSDYWDLLKSPAEQYATEGYNIALFPVLSTSCNPLHWTSALSGFLRSRTGTKSVQDAFSKTSFTSTLKPDAAMFFLCQKTIRN